MSGHRADLRFKVLIYIYSFLAHFLIFFCVISCFKSAGDAKTDIIELNKNAKMPFSFKVSLTGRKGNTYDASKNADGVDMDNIKKNIFENLNLMKQKYDLAKVSIPEVPKVAEKPAEKPVEKTVKVIEPEKKTVSEKKVPEVEKPAAKPKKAEKKEKEKPELKDLTAEERLRIKERQAALEKAGKAEAEKMAKDTAARQNMNSAQSDFNGANAGEAGPAVYGNMSGDRNFGNDIAGTPDGKADPLIELNRVELFKSLVSEKIKKGVKYPERCRKLGIEGNVRLSFEIARNGKVLNAGVSQSSGNEEIDASAISAVKSGEPFLPFPQGAGGETIKFVIPLNYELNAE